MAKTSDKFRKNAHNCLQLADGATIAQATRRYKRMARAWSALAAEQDWLDGYPIQNDRASELAGDAIDGLRDKDASDADAKARKSHPVEFRDARVDND
ncbi:hypothetical protein ABIF65_005676 [Bradyrhizobium japonicum]|uniref:hypothetical protein n=1 Tax=Bradyrhizobium TaxID=374 RepID=UPI0009B7F8DC|nr:MULTISPECIES: hypothetical protein [Bradyrhizobium]MBR0884777.1 hypothetical protein [Bradyrhizobium liaoningense]MBR1005101.1 hypothetical protein [Bradyrhizobium liaoningense]MBR1071366.1 hypothetical protein [Bradyrhizobium liaoningense]MCP1744008.1 hypothetical protein [Bradyrhizobium japonicum]MCP1861724.1 hypothetical protein [Bradyrhizobium japonicum]